jgi:aromatic ring-cleaving dioxygenase
MNKTNFEQALADQLADVNKGKQPERDLWLGIELALSSEASEPPRVTLGKRMYFVAATVATFGLIGWLSVNQQSVSLTGDDLVASLSAQHIRKMLYWSGFKINLHLPKIGKTN